MTSGASGPSRSERAVPDSKATALPPSAPRAHDLPPESAAEHVRNALQILKTAGGTSQLHPAVVYRPADIAAIGARLDAALEELESTAHVASGMAVQITPKRERCPAVHPKWAGHPVFASQCFMPAGHAGDHHIPSDGDRLIEWPNEQLESTAPAFVDDEPNWRVQLEQDRGTRLARFALAFLSGAIVALTLVALAGCARRYDVGVHRVAGERCPADEQFIYTELRDRRGGLEPFTWCRDTTRRAAR